MQIAQRFRMLDMEEQIIDLLRLVFIVYSQPLEKRNLPVSNASVYTYRNPLAVRTLIPTY